MKENIYLSNRLREVLLEGQWIANTNWRKQLLDTYWLDAEIKVDNLNSIADLAFHLKYYIGGVLSALKGGSLDIKDQHSFDRDLILNESHWFELVSEFIDLSDQLCETIAEMPENQFGEIFVDEKYGSIKRNIDGMIEHAYYHLAQLTQVRKLIAVHALSEAI